MRVTTLDMRRDPKKILDAIARNETVTLTHRGKPVASIAPIRATRTMKVAEHPAVGMWADRPEMADAAAYIRQLRKGRFDDL